MSLEQAITDHASALRELAAAIRAAAGGTHVNTAAAADKVINDAKAQASTATKPQASVVTKPADEIKAAAEAAVEGAKAALTYEDVKTKVLALSKDKGRDQVVALLQRHGVAKAPDLKAEQYEAVIADVDAILAGTLDVIAGELA